MAGAKKLVKFLGVGAHESFIFFVSRLSIKSKLIQAKFSPI